MASPTSSPTTTNRGHSRKDFLNFIYNAGGSLAEVETQIEITHSLGYIDHETHLQLQLQIEELSKILTGLVKSLRTENTALTSG